MQFLVINQNSLEKEYFSALKKKIRDTSFFLITNLFDNPASNEFCRLHMKKIHEANSLGVVFVVCFFLCFFVFNRHGLLQQFF